MPVDLGDTQLLVFEIPYGIRIEEGFQFSQGDTVELEFYGGEDPPEIEVLLGERPARIRFSQNVNRDRIQFGGEFTVEGDRLGRTISTDVLMHFSDEFMDSIPSEVIEETPPDYHSSGTIIGSNLEPPLDKHLITWGVNYLNKFLEGYRFFENEYWLKPLTPQTIQEFDLIRAEDGTFDRHRKRIWTRGPSRGGSIEMEQLQEFLRTNTKIPLVQRLRLSSRDNIDIGDYQEAIIQSAQLFELWLINAYILISKSNGEDESEAEEEITKPNGDFFHPNNIFDKIESNYEYDFTSTDEFDQWDSSTKEVRNDIIHSGYEPQRPEAFSAYESCMDAIYEIQEEFGEDISQSTLEDIVQHPLPGSNILIERNDG